MIGLNDADQARIQKTMCDWNYLRQLALFVL